MTKFGNVAEQFKKQRTQQGKWSFTRPPTPGALSRTTTPKLDPLLDQAWYDCRSVEEAEDPMSRMEFQLPPEALVPLPGSTPPPKRRPAAAAAAAATSEDPFDAFGSMPGSAAQQAAVRNDFGDLESLAALGAPQAQAAAGKVACPCFLSVLKWHALALFVNALLYLLSPYPRHTLVAA